LPKNVQEKVGIFIPTYNRLHYLKEALLSALTQSHSDISILTIDDGSTDGTPEYLREINDPRFSYVVNEYNLGLARNIDKGIRLFPENVEWCTILGDDDVLDQDYVQAMLEAVRFSAATSIVHGRRIIIDKRGNFIRHTKDSPPEESALDYLVNRLRKYRETFLTGVFFRTETFRKIGGYPSFRTGTTADDAFIFALALQDRLVYTKYATAKQRFHQDAESLSCRDIGAILETTEQFRMYCKEMASRYSNPRVMPPNLLTGILERYAREINSDCWLQYYRNTVGSKESFDGTSNMPQIPNRYPEQFSRRTRMDAHVIRMFKIFPENYFSYRAFWFFIECIRNWGWGKKFKWSSA
jgi:glycosyltransferase involved in cell wall biosynthesis